MYFQTGKQFFIVDFYTHNKRIGHVIIPKPHCSSRECINSHCRRFGWLIFPVLAQSVAAKYYRSGCCCSDVAGHSTVTAMLPVPLVHSSATCPRVGIRDSLRIFFARKKLGRTETRTRDRMYCQTIRTVRYISRDDRARIATCSLRTSTDRHKENYSRPYRWPATGIVWPASKIKGGAQP